MKSKKLEGLDSLILFQYLTLGYMIMVDRVSWWDPCFDRADFRFFILFFLKTMICIDLKNPTVKKSIVTVKNLSFLFKKIKNKNFLNYIFT